jgi:hypothetical protein
MFEYHTQQTAEGNLALKEAIGQDGNRYYCAKCKTAGEVCTHFLEELSSELSSHFILQYSIILQLLECVCMFI